MSRMKMHNGAMLPNSHTAEGRNQSHSVETLNAQYLVAWAWFSQTGRDFSAADSVRGTGFGNQPLMLP